jgi:CheY-like chemotaxis protein
LQEQNCAQSLLSGKSILLIEDSKDTQFILTLLLEDAGAEVCCVDYGEIGIEKVLNAAINNKPYSVVLIDVQLPGISGFSVAKQIRASSYNGLLIAMTARCIAQDYEASVYAGFNGYLNKASSKNNFLSTLKLYCDIDSVEQIKDFDFKSKGLPLDLTPISVAQEFIYRLQESANALNEAWLREDREKIRLLLQVLRSGKIFGYPEVSNAASAWLEDPSASTNSLNEYKGYLDSIKQALSDSAQ